MSMVSCSGSSRRILSLPRLYLTPTLPNAPRPARVHIRLSTSAAKTKPPPAPAPPSTSLPKAKAKSPRSQPPRASPEPPHHDSTQPLILFEGPAQQRAAVSWFILGAFSLIGVSTGYNLSRHLSWPLGSPDQSHLVDPKKRYVVGFLAASLSIGTGSLFKYVSSKSVVRITLFQPPGQPPMLKISTVTKPIFPRGFFRRAVKPYILEGHGEREFTAPLANVFRRHGSAVAQGWIDERSGGVERRSITIDIGGDAYLMEGSGANEPRREELSLIGYGLKYFNWKYLRGSPSAPYFWSRQAFDELIPQQQASSKGKTQ